MSYNNSTKENKFNVQSNRDLENASNENNEDSEIMKEIELSLKRDQAENEKLPKEIVINGKKYTDIRVRDANIDSLVHEENIKQIEERMRLDREENKRLPTKAVINGHEFTNIKVRDVQVEPHNNEEDDNMRQIEERMRLDREENKKLPTKAVINGHEFTNIKVRDVQVQPRSIEDDNMRQIEERMRLDREENKKLPTKAVINGHEFTNIRVRDVQVEPHNNEEDDNMRQIEECLRRDQEESKGLPEKAVIGGHEFTNIQVREVKLEPEGTNQSQPPVKMSGYCYDRSVFYQPFFQGTSPRRRVCKTKKPIKLTVTLKDIGMEKFETAFSSPGKSNEHELPRLNGAKQCTGTRGMNGGGLKEKDLPRLANRNSISVQANIQEPEHGSAKGKSPRRNKEHVSTYDPSIFRSPPRSDSPVKPVRYFNDPIKLTVTLKDIGMEGLDSPLQKQGKKK